MERVLLMVLGLLISVPAFSDVILSPGVKTNPWEEDSRFPESRFGSEPAKLNLRRDLSWKDPAHTEGARSIASVSEPKQESSSSALIPNRQKGIQEVAIIATDLGYFPKAVFVTRDIPVRMYVTGASSKSLCLMMDSFGVRKQVKSEHVQEITFTPSVPGKYRYYCPVNGMEGTMVVRELGANTKE